MKTSKILFSIVMISALMLGACVPVQSPTEPYPIDDSEEPTAEVEKPGEVTDASGSVAYIVDPQADPQAVKQLAQSNNGFALALYQALRGEEGNLIYSPYSIFQALLMTAAGAKGATASQMASVLGVDLNDPEIHNLMNALNQALTTQPENLQGDAQPLTFTVANAVWAQKDFHFEQAFLDTLSANYNAGLKLVDFNKPEDARALINLWVAAQTNDKIKELIPEGVLNEMTRMVLTNAIYFKGAWSNQFEEKDTKDGSFTLIDGSSKTVPFMHGNFTLSALVNDKLSAVRLPYEGGTYAMAAIMPQADFAEFEAQLTAEDLEQLLSDLQSSSAMVDLSMPKFQAESRFALADILAELGMPDAFDAQKADFSGMTGKPDLMISSVLHQATIDVNEEGTEAAAATAVAVSVTSMPSQSYTIRLDKPFIYVIYETTTNAIVFMGRVVNP
ncbi:MAG TPA: serpin family protein [Anaerolineaceae bacterium]|nr:serpin family protein [Anaerolineaceae bacterium]